MSSNAMKGHMTSEVDQDLLSLVRAAERQARTRRQARRAQAMNKQEKVEYLRKRGWRRRSKTGSETWQSPDGQRTPRSAARPRFNSRWMAVVDHE
jgi:hypothetical protein